MLFGSKFTKKIRHHQTFHLPISGLIVEWEIKRTKISEFEGETDIELAAGQVVRHGVTDIVDVCHPIVSADV